MNAFRRLAGAAFLALAPVAAAALEDCRFGYDVTTESTDFQALVEGATTRGGFWRPIREAPQDVQDLARYVGRLEICMMTADGRPRPVVMADGVTRERSIVMTSCTATLLPGNRLLTNHHCFYGPEATEAGFTIVREARVNFGYTDPDVTASISTFLVNTRELATATDVDALVLGIFGDANADRGGHFPLVMQGDVPPLHPMTMIHHPGGGPLHFSDGTCQVHSRQGEIGAEVSNLRHRCESTGGSSGALLLDARTLEVIGLHNQGGLSRTGGFNGGHKIGFVSDALDLGFEQRRRDLSLPPEDMAALQEQLASALLAREAMEAELARALTEAEAAQSEARMLQEQLAAANTHLSDVESLSAQAQRQVVALNLQVRQLTNQVSSFQTLLNLAEEADRENSIQFEALGTQLNTALARAAAAEIRQREAEAEARRLTQENAGRLSAERDALLIELRSCQQTASACSASEN